MKDDTVKRKVSVFISSKCDDTYSIVRKALKTLLEETGLVSVYVFEDEPASSKVLGESYLDELDASDLVVFLVRNIDKVSEPVLIEHKRARSLDKRSLYVFCDDKCGEVTELQNELIQSHIVKFQVVHEFCDVAREAYVATLTDIISIYRKNNFPGTPVQMPTQQNLELQKKMTEPVDKDESQINHSSSNLLIYDVKDYSKIYPRTTSVIGRFLSETNDLAEPSSQLDTELSTILLRVLGQTNSFPDYTFDTVLAELPSVCIPQFTPLILARWKAIRSYFASDAMACEAQLQQIWNKIKDDSNIYGWVLANVLIDLRNQSAINDRYNNQIRLDGAQNHLNSLTFPAYYPVLDRLTKNVEEEVLEDYVTELLKPPNVTILGSSIDHLSDSLSSSFIIAALHGSLTHILLIKEQLEKVLLRKCLKRRNHRIYINLLSLYVLSYSEDKLEKVFRLNQPNSDVLNDTDAASLWNIANNSVLSVDRFNARLFVWGKLCDYFSDEIFSELSSACYLDIEAWIDDPHKIVNSGGLIFKSLAATAFRGDSNRTLQLLCKAIDRNIIRFADEIHKATKKLDYSVVNDENIELLLTKLFEQCKSDKKQNYHLLPELLLNIRIRKPKLSRRIDTIVKDSFPNYYSTTYELEISSSTKKYARHIERYINTAKKRNEQQGKGGSYSGYSDDPNSIIGAIIKDNPKVLTKQVKLDILLTAKETIEAATQTLSAKVNAIHLVETLWLLVDEDDKQLIKAEMYQVFQERQSFGVVLDFFSDATETPYLISKGLLQLMLNDDNTEQLVEQILSFERYNSNNILLVLNEFNEFIALDNHHSRIEELYSAIIQFAFEMTNNKNNEVREAAALVLVRATKTKYKEMCLRRLSTLMDSGVSTLEVAILYGILKYSSKPYTSFSYIIQKGLVDNNFQVRRFAHKLTN